MKNNLILGIFTLLTMSLMSFSCSSDDDDGGSNNNDATIQLEASITVGTWRVSNFVEDGNNQTNHFSGYVFTFSSNGTVVASNGTNTVNGTWATGVDDSTPKFILNFAASTGPFEEISEDWRIESTSSTVIDLKHVSGGDGSIDLLTFTKL